MAAPRRAGPPISPLIKSVVVPSIARYWAAKPQMAQYVVSPMRRRHFVNGLLGDQGGHCHRRVEPYAGPGAPGACPHCMTRNTGRTQCFHTTDPCKTVTY